jgi:Flp pilus assembly pilin Flp
MRQRLLRFWREECGAVIAADWVLMATILVLGLIVGAATVRQTRSKDCGVGATDLIHPR